VAEVARMKPDFVMTVGDMIEGYKNDTSQVKKEWEEYFSIVEPLRMPIHFTPGNHDIWDSTSQMLYERYVGSPYYSFTVEGVHFAILDNSRWDTVGAFPREQIDWLVNDLEENSGARYTLVFFHKPFWIETVAQSKPDTLHAVLANYGVDAVFNGHYHIYFAGESDGVRYTTLGSSGGSCSPGPTGLQYHFAWITIDSDGIAIAPVKMGSVIPWNEVSASEYLLTREAQYRSIRTTKASVTEDLKVPKTVVTVSVENLGTEFAIDDTMRWDIPAGWSVTPLVLPVRVEPAGIYSADVTVKSTGMPYPAPSASMYYKYAEGKKFKIEHALTLSRTAEAREATVPPVIDGRLDDASWKTPVKALFTPDGSSSATTDPASFYFAWDENNLYVAARCVENKIDSIAASVSEHDGPVYGEDCVGYFIQPETDDGPVYQIYFNPKGVVFDQKIIIKDKTPVAVDREWNGVYDVSTSRDKDSWTIEARIALSELGAEAHKGKTWGINFRRKQKRLNTTADWLVPLGYDPETYGLLAMR
jgi:hypothetical protein